MSARIDAERGDIAARPVEHEHPVLPLTVAVSRFEDRTERGHLPKGEIDAFSKSYAAVLRESKVFLDVFPAKAAATGVRGPADLKIRGSILRARLYRNYAWLTSWGVIAVGTLGYGAIIGPALGLPWATDNAALEIEVRVETADGAPVAKYKSAFVDKLWLTAYSGDEAQTGYCEDPRRALQQVVAANVERLIDDYGRYRAIADKRNIK